MTLLTLEAEDAAAVLDTLGGRVVQLTVRGHDLLVPDTGRPTLAGCYPMVPWVGRLGDGRFVFDGQEIQVPLTNPPHAMHGLGTDEEWTVLRPGVMTLDMSALWPLGGAATVEYQLTRSSLTCIVAVQAPDGGPMPAVVGFHPCFVRRLGGNSDSLGFAGEFMWERGSDYLPTGARRLPPPPGRCRRRR